MEETQFHLPEIKRILQGQHNSLICTRERSDVLASAMPSLLVGAFSLRDNFRTSERFFTKAIYIDIRRLNNNQSLFQVPRGAIG